MENIRKKLEIIRESSEEAKAIDYLEIDMMGKSAVADYYVIVSGNTSNQVVAIANRIDLGMKEYTEDNFVKEGYKSGRWIAMDYGDVVVHIFHKEEREFYNLERLLEEREEE